MAGPRGASLATMYDLLMFDLDGVVYVDGHPVPHAAESIAHARDAGVHIAFITNNASRTPQQVAGQLRDFGIAAEAHDVVTSAQAAARLMLDAHGSGSPIAVLGARGLADALVEAGLEPVEVGDPRAVAVVSGYGPDLPWRVIMHAATLIRNGLPWVASNTDLTLPTDDGLAPGHGMLVRLISDFAGVTPDVAGKPRRPLLDETMRRVGGQRPLMVGDRLDTDIAGAAEAGVESLLVLTGVSTVDDVLRAAPGERPTWLGQDLTALRRPGLRATADGAWWTSGSWRARVEQGRLVVEGDGTDPGGRDAWWTAIAAAGWDHLDRSGSAADSAGVTEPGRPTSAG